MPQHTHLPWEEHVTNTLKMRTLKNSSNLKLDYNYIGIVIKKKQLANNNKQNLWTYFLRKIFTDLIIVSFHIENIYK